MIAKLFRWPAPETVASSGEVEVAQDDPIHLPPDLAAVLARVMFSVGLVTVTPDRTKGRMLLKLQAPAAFRTRTNSVWMPLLTVLKSATKFWSMLAPGVVKFTRVPSR